MIDFLINLTPIKAVLAIFDNDEYHIVSERGWEILNDEEKMKEINQIIKEGKHNGIII